MDSSEIDYPCPHCGKTTTIFIEIESFSDYYPSKTCEFCSNEINDSDLDMKIMDEVTDYLVGKAEYYKE